MPKLSHTLASLFGLKRKPKDSLTAAGVMKAATKAASRPKSKAGRDQVKIRASGECTFDVVGESKYQEALRQIGEGHNFDAGSLPCEADLVPEPSNKFDANAVYVRIANRKVAYLAREDAPDYLAELDRYAPGRPTARVKAEITGGYALAKGQRAHFGVRLDMDWPVDFA